MQTVGFIGLGSQGGPMAQRIRAAGFPLGVWARRPEVLEPFRKEGAQIAPSPEAIATACDHVAVCVVDDAGVVELCAKLIPAMRPQSRLVIHSTVRPETCLDLAAACAQRGVDFLDAPVSGGGPAAAAGALTIMCGATQAAFDAAQPVFSVLGKTIILLGGVGAGQRAKLINNALMAANMSLAHAALVTGTTLGLSRDALASLLQQSSGRSFGLEVLARLPTPQAFAHGGALLTKDVDLLEASLLPGTDRAQQILDCARAFLSIVRTNGANE